ncbi:hypothetical protein HD600_001867 [Microbacterium ginsengiterrae]|uniref:Glycosyl transferase family 1 n=1 Tax=Microbacterium ginsengiterrae TaxID=546115 RepID=A0A7W9CD41_9MICO|nr:glycosyltransferase [Microbacterium ginsengiterrae]MBB5743370.1 hypothetical protein [Microbacterium ginsengiterrae]
MTPVVQTADAAIRRSGAIVDRLIDVAVSRARARRFSSAAQWARTAANYAMTNASGQLRSTRLEVTIDLIAARALPVSPPRRPLGDRRRVLHVLSEAAEIGGLTRLAARWITHEETSVSSVAVTRQTHVTASLEAAVRRSGGEVHALGSGDPVRSAGRLRGLSAEFDTIVCHLQPDDPIPALAFGAGYGGPPVAVFNHADHLFLLAPTRATTIVDFRPVGQALSIRARGYLPQACFMLPLLVPDDGNGTQASGASDDGQVVAVTVARPVKFQDTALAPTFAGIVAEALERHPNIVVRAVGPRPEEAPWPELQRRYPARVQAVGPVSDPMPYLRSADVYIDTFPFSSLTSLLEASSLSLPVLTLDAHHGLRRAFGIADFVADDSDRPADLDGFLARLGDLVSGPEERRAGGERARRSYELMVPSDEWARNVRDLYEVLDERVRDGRMLGESAAPLYDEELAHYHRGLLAIEQRVPLLWTMIGYLPGFDDRERAWLSARITLVRAVQKVARTLRLPVEGAERLLVPAPREGRS